jgi:hypothetical protein
VARPAVGTQSIWSLDETLVIRRSIPPMKLQDINAQVGLEREAMIPRGPKQSEQNAARMIYTLLRMNSLGARAEVPADPAALLSMAFRLAATSPD